MLHQRENLGSSIEKGTSPLGESDYKLYGRSDSKEVYILFQRVINPGLKSSIQDKKSTGAVPQAVSLRAGK